MEPPKITEGHAPRASQDLPPGPEGSAPSNADQVARLVAWVEDKNSTLPHMTVSKADELPSRGLMYPPGWGVRYRSYSYAEVQDLNLPRRSAKPAYVLGLAGIETTGFPKERLTFQDFLYVMLLRKLLVLGTSEFSLQTRCPHCGTHNSQPMKTSDISWRDIEAPKLPVQADLSGATLTFAPLTVGRMIEYMGTELDPHASVSMYQAHELCEGTEGLELEMARKVFDRAHESDDVALLEQVDRILSHGVNLVAVECTGQRKDDKGQTGCGRRYTVQPTSLVESFISPFPDGSREDALATKIRYGTEARN